MFCSYCDSRIFEEDRVCPQCGAGTKDSYFNRELVEKSPFEDVLAIAVQNFPEKMTCGQSLDLRVYGINKNYDKIIALYGYEISLNKVYLWFHGKIVEFMKRNPKV